MKINRLSDRPTPTRRLTPGVGVQDEVGLLGAADAKLSARSRKALPMGARTLSCVGPRPYRTTVGATVSFWRLQPGWISGSARPKSRVDQDL